MNSIINPSKLTRASKIHGKRKENTDEWSESDLIVVEFEAHAVVDFVVLESNMILVDIVPLLNPNLLGSSPSLGSHELLQVADGVVFVALHSHLLPQPIVQHHLDHLVPQKCKTLVVSEFNKSKCQNQDSKNAFCAR